MQEKSFDRCCSECGELLGWGTATQCDSCAGYQLSKSRLRGPVRLIDKSCDIFVQHALGFYNPGTCSGTSSVH